MSHVKRKLVLKFLSLSSKPSKPFVGYDTDYRILLCSLHRFYFIVHVMSKEILAELVGTSQAFFWCDNDKDLKTCFRMTELIYKHAIVSSCLPTIKTDKAHFSPNSCFY